MKIKTFYLLLLILVSCGTSKSLNSKPIFRHVNLYTYGKFELGDDLKKINSLTEKINNKIFLKKNVFGQAESIELIPDSEGKIKAIIFNYGNKTSLESEINDYKNILENPTINHYSAIWNDGNTTFELYKEKDNVFSKMSDIK